MRDSSRSKLRRVVCGIFALGWRGSGRHWAEYKWAYLLLAGLSTPLVLSVHSVVSFDFRDLALARLAHHRLSALFSCWRHSFPASAWCSRG